VVEVSSEGRVILVSMEPEKPGPYGASFPPRLVN